MRTYWFFICLLICASTGISVYDFRQHNSSGITQAILTCCIPLAVWLAWRIGKKRNTHRK